MARAIVWPQVETPPAAQPSEAPPPFDAGALAAALGPELTRAAGLRTSAAPGRGEGPWMLLCRMPLSDPRGLVALGLWADAKGASALLERLFGAPRDGTGARPEDLQQLPPGSASWATLCRLLGGAVQKAGPAAGLVATGTPRPTPRAIPDSGPDGLVLAIEMEGTAARLLLVPEAAVVPPAPKAEPDRAAWRAEVRARAFDLELPVAVRLATKRVSLAELSALGPGDIVPLDRPDSVEILAGGRQVARIPADRLARRPDPEGGQ